jgi:hypothetical protein
MTVFNVMTKAPSPAFPSLMIFYLPLADNVRNDR